MKNEKFSLGVIGLGDRMTGMTSRFLRTGKCDITAVVETNLEGAKHRMKHSFGWDDDKIASVHFYTDADEMFKNEELDGVCVGTRCSLHTKFALKAIERELPLFLEKPISTNKEDLQKLKDALKAHPSANEKTVVSFPLRITQQITTIKEIVASGQIGTIEHVQAVNDVPYGRVYYHDWYRDENETGGLWLQKATHDFDYINAVLETNPVEICAMSSKRIFGGNKPAGLYCKDCPDRASCSESPENIAYYTGEPSYGQMCCFAVDTGNEDSGTAIIRYESGMHVVYSQNFYARRGAGKRGARFIGYKGTIDFDWQCNNVTVYMHNSRRTDIIRLEETSDGHGGGDAELSRSFIDILSEKAPSRAPLKAGILSVDMCLAAKESCQNSRFVKIPLL